MDGVGKLIVALWHVVGLLLLLVIIAELGVEGWRRLQPPVALPPVDPSRSQRCGRRLWRRRLVGRIFQRVPPLRPGRVETLCRMVAASVHRRVPDRRPARASAHPRRGRSPIPGGPHSVLWRLDDDGDGRARRADNSGGARPPPRRSRTSRHSDQLRPARPQQHAGTDHPAATAQIGGALDIAVFYDGINEMACAEQTGRADAVVQRGTPARRVQPAASRAPR